MEYLHSRRVVHFDLKCDNLLCDLRDLNRPVVKIADLGLSKKKAATFVSGNMRGTLPWMAPELFPSMQQEQDPVSKSPALLHIQWYSIETRGVTYHCGSLAVVVSCVHCCGGTIIGAPCQLHDRQCSFR